MRKWDIGVTSMNDLVWKMELEYFECSTCGFHFAVDSTYLLQVNAINMKCPSCDNKISICGDTGD